MTAIESWIWAMNCRPAINRLAKRKGLALAVTIRLGWDERVGLDDGTHQ